MAKLRVMLYAEEFPSYKDIDLVLPISDMYEEFCTPLKLSDSVFSMSDTPSATVQRVCRMRKDAANLLAEAILKALAEKDKVNGYTAKERAAWWGRKA